eukprot:360150-Chlamydomonas_euryale.AAC.4
MERGKSQTRLVRASCPLCKSNYLIAHRNSTHLISLREFNRLIAPCKLNHLIAPCKIQPFDCALKIQISGPGQLQRIRFHAWPFHARPTPTLHSPHTHLVAGRPAPSGHQQTTDKQKQQPTINN